MNTMFHVFLVSSVAGVCTEGEGDREETFSSCHSRVARCHGILAETGGWSLGGGCGLKKLHPLVSALSQYGVESLITDTLRSGCRMDKLPNLE